MIPQVELNNGQVLYRDQSVLLMSLVGCTVHRGHPLQQQQHKISQSAAGAAPGQRAQALHQQRLFSQFIQSHLRSATVVVSTRERQGVQSKNKSSESLRATFSC